MALDWTPEENVRSLFRKNWPLVQ